MAQGPYAGADPSSLRDVDEGGAAQRLHDFHFRAEVTDSLRGRSSRSWGRTPSRTARDRARGQRDFRQCEPKPLAH